MKIEATFYNYRTRIHETNTYEIGDINDIGRIDYFKFCNYFDSSEEKEVIMVVYKDYHIATFPNFGQNEFSMDERDFGDTDTHMIMYCNGKWYNKDIVNVIC